MSRGVGINEINGFHVVPRKHMVNTAALAEAQQVAPRQQEKRPPKKVRVGAAAVPAREARPQSAVASEPVPEIRLMEGCVLCPALDPTQHVDKVWTVLR